jgi:hypothetical protein
MTERFEAPQNENIEAMPPTDMASEEFVAENTRAIEDESLVDDAEVFPPETNVEAEEFEMGSVDVFELDDPEMNGVMNSQLNATMGEMEAYFKQVTHEGQGQSSDDVLPSREEIEALDSHEILLNIPKRVRTASVAALGSLMLFMAAGTRSAEASDYWWQEEPVRVESPSFQKAAPSGAGDWQYVESHTAEKPEKQTGYEKRMDKRFNQTVNQGVGAMTKTLGGGTVRPEREMASLQKRGAAAVGDTIKQTISGGGWSYASQGNQKPTAEQKRMNKRVDQTINQGVGIVTRSLSGKKINSVKEQRNLQKRGAAAVGDYLKLLIRGAR